MSESKLKVYFDGACHLCSREIAHYKKIDTASKLELVDISAKDFDAGREGLSAVNVNKYMHVRNSKGEIKTGVEAFLEIWSVFPQYNLIGKLVRNPLVRPFVNIGYHTFAALRPFLPKRKISDSCSIGAKK